MEGEEGKGELRGCIKTTKGPWIVHRATKDGGIVTKYRFPSEKERQKNKQRERKRRSVAKKIFAGLREHGNYNLPKHADSNELLMALCEEAGWHVEKDGTIHKKKLADMPSLVEVGSSSQVSKNGKSDDEDYCTCDDQNAIFPSEGLLALGQPCYSQVKDLRGKEIACSSVCTVSHDCSKERCPEQVTYDCSKERCPEQPNHPFYGFIV